MGPRELLVLVIMTFGASARGDAPESTALEARRAMREAAIEKADVVPAPPRAQGSGGTSDSDSRGVGEPLRARRRLGAGAHGLQIERSPDLHREVHRAAIEAAAAAVAVDAAKLGQAFSGGRDARGQGASATAAADAARGSAVRKRAGGSGGWMSGGR